MISRRILIVEDEAPAARLIAEHLSSVCSEIVIASDGKEALELYEAKPFPVVITDIEMPVMDGNELISHLKLFAEPPVIFITTSHSEPELIIDIMKKGVHDYLLKPINGDDLRLKVIRAFDTYELMHSRYILEQEKIARLQHQIEWYHWQEKAARHKTEGGHSSLFNVLQTSFNQGAGFGVLVSLINILNFTAAKQDNGYLISDDLFEMIRKNGKMAEKALETFSEIDNLMKREIETEEISSSSLFEFVEQRCETAQKIGGIRDNRIIMSSRPDVMPGGNIRINRETMTYALDEILLNACKFSADGKPISILFQNRRDRITISILNSPRAADESGKVGIPGGYENMVFEPFFRMTGNLYEEYESLDFGLGLTRVEYIIRKTGGTIEIGNVMDYSRVEANPELRVSCDITLPLA